MRRETRTSTVSSFLLRALPSVSSRASSDIAPLEPQTLGLERERARIAVGEHPLEPSEGRRLLGGRRVDEQLVECCSSRAGSLVSHSARLDYQRLRGPRHMGRAAYLRARRPYCP